VKFTRIPKIQYLMDQGVPVEAIPTFCALADYSHNKSALAWPKMETIAKTLNRSVRTVQRHVHLLAKIGVIQILERKRYKGRFSSYLYKITHITRTTGHARPKAGRPPIYKERTKPSMNRKLSIDYKDQEARRRSQERKRRTEGYEWLFN
jgi:hypothetical protein